MSPDTSIFGRFGQSDVHDLIVEFPLAWVCARGGGVDHASLLPLIGQYDAAGRLTHVIGHLSRANPLFEALSGDPRALIMFRGPEGYVSPADAGVRDWAPTWNYAELRLEADVSFDAISTEQALTVLIAAMEANHADPWSSAELGARYTQMSRRIIGFRAAVTTLRGKFKLGQDEDPKVFDSILENTSDPAMVRWMKRFNSGRGV